MEAAVPIYSITPFTLLDYPDKTACILWFAGCNMRCLYCYNPDIVQGKGAVSLEKALRFLRSRMGILDGVVLSGGECTLHKDLIPFIKEIKAMGFSVKLDTNGTKPQVLKQLVKDRLTDYIALDFKALACTYKEITGSGLFHAFEEILIFLIHSRQPFEVRTTVHSDLINESDFSRMVSFLEDKNYSGNYYVQHFMNGVPTLGSLGYSSNNLKKESFSTGNIQVIFR